MKRRNDTRYLLFSINPLARKKVLSIRREGRLLLDLELRLDAVHPVSEVAVDVGRFGEGELEITCDPAMEIPMRASDDPAWPADLYREVLRPHARFTARRGWINDPNGLVFHQEMYHLFFQYNPVGTDWGNMHWGHATSRDLIFWEEHDIALFPDEAGTMFSGSAIVDEDNRLGLNTADQTAIVLFYTCAGNTSVLSMGKPFTQNIAYSLDGGHTFVKHPANPVIPQLCDGNRDPKVVRSPGGGYVMALYLEGNTYALLHSENLTEWTLLQKIDLPEDTECPDFYPLTTPDGDVRWVLGGAADRYLVGHFDGTRFVPEGPAEKLHYGTHAYAAQSWSDLPASDGRRIRIAWNTFDLPGMAFNRSMTFPTEMSLRRDGDRCRLCATPVREIAKLRRNAHALPAFTVDPGMPFTLPVNRCAYDVSLIIECAAPDTMEPPAREAATPVANPMKPAIEAGFILKLFGMELLCDADKRELRCQNSIVPMPDDASVMTLRLLVDVSGMEVFLDGGSRWLSMGMVADWNLDRLELVAQGRPARVRRLEVAELGNIWE